MENEQEEQVHEEGLPWKVVAKYPTYELADQERHILSKEPNLQVKVKYMSPSKKKDYFAVKTRVDPEVQLAERKTNKKKKRKS